MIPASGWRTLRSVLTSASTPDQVHACQMMTEVATVSIVAKNKYSGKAGGLPHPARGGTKVREPFTRVITPPAIIFASRFALNGSSQHARIMAMGISIKTGEPIRAHGERGSKEVLQSTISVLVDIFYPQNFGDFERKGFFNSHSPVSLTCYGSK